MEKRKEKSRDAARCRRSKETEIFTDLSSMLPLSKNCNVAHLDKASIVRLAISYLKIRTIVQSVPAVEYETGPIAETCSADSLFLNALEGFLLVTSSDGDIVFISENVSRYLGLAQVDVLGQSVYELSHPCDHSEIKDMLSTKDLNAHKSYFLRMKCTLTSKGRNVNIKSASYKVIQFSGRMMESLSKPCFENMKREQSGSSSSSDGESSDSGTSDDMGSLEPKAPTSMFHFVSVGEPISHPANIEIPLGQDAFLTKHSLDMKFTYADERIVDFFGYNTNTLLEKSVFDYHHAEDSVALRKSFKNLFQKGQSQTERYRFLAAGGGYAWVLTQATVIYSNSSKPLSVVCVNFVISGIENPNEIYSLCQLDTDGGSALSTLTSNAAAPDYATASAGEVNDRYVLQNSPQRLIEKLRIDSTGSNQRTHAAVETAAAATVARRRRDELYCGAGAAVATAATAATTAPAVAGDSPDWKGVVALAGPPSVGDFLVNCSSPSSTSSDASSAAASPPPLDPAEWLMTDDEKRPAAVFEATDVTDSVVDATIDLTHVKLEVPTPVETPKNSDCGRTVPAANVDINSERVFSTVKLLSTVSKAPKPATANVFVPFTEDMNKGFMGFTDDDNELTMLKEDPEDLTHLAPTAGDVCVPLDENPIEYVLPDMLDEIILSDCKLLSNDVDRDLSPSSPNSYFSYRDDLEPSSRPLSPILSQNEDCSIPSLCSDESPLHGDSVNPFLDFEDLMRGEEINDLSAKASLIPLTLDTDPMLPFVTNDFMWGSSSEESPWSSVSSSPSSNCSLSPRLDHNSSLAKLLTTSPIDNYDGGGDGGDGANRKKTVDAKRTNVGPSEGDIGGRTSYVTNRAAERNYSTVSFNKSGGSTYQRSSSANSGRSDGPRRRCNGNASRLTGSAAGNGNLHSSHQNARKDANSRGEDRRKNGGGSGHESVVGAKRSSSENWGRGVNFCKRSRQTSRTIIINGTTTTTTTTGGNKRMHESTAAAAVVMAEAVAAAKQTNSVLMNLLVSGCDLNAGYEEDYSKQPLKRTYDGHLEGHDDFLKDVNLDPADALQWARVKRRIMDLLVPQSSNIPSLMDLTEQDYAVNAPSTGELLQGSELLKALEYSETLNLR